jgi:uncharacterized membrane protein
MSKTFRLRVRELAERSSGGEVATDGADHQIISRRRLSVCVAAGIAAAAGLASLGLVRLAILVGWAVTSTAVLVWVWRISWPQDSDGTKRLAEAEGRTHVTEMAVLLAAVASLVAIVNAVATAGRHDAVAVAVVVLAAVDTILSWALVHTVYALKYARFYYLGVDGGIAFSSDERPTYSDFAYLAFTVGMSFAVSDSQLAATEGRKLGLGHALLSYLFGTILIASAVSLLTSL